MNKSLFPTRNKLILYLILTLGIFLRFYQLETRTNFTADQGRDYLLVKHLLDDKKLTLLGPKASVGDFFFGPFYYYLLLPAVFLGRFDPLSGVVLTAGLDSLSLILFSIFTKRLLSTRGSLIATSLYATFPVLINLVKIPLNPFVIPVFSVLFLLSLSLNSNRYPLVASLGLGFLAGLLFQLHFSTLPLFFLGLIWQFKAKTKLYSLMIYLTGFGLGILPMILFELRHQFFNFHQIVNYLSHPKISPSFSEHYFIYLLPPLFLLVGKFISFFPKLVQTVIISAILFFSLYTLLKPVDEGYLMPQGWNLPGVRQATALIAADSPPQKFEVAAMLDGDTRALPYRYLLEAKYNKIPLSVEAYPQADTLYVITREPAEAIINNSVWEISSLVKKQVVKTWAIQNAILLHRLDKVK